MSLVRQDHYNILYVASQGAVGYFLRAGMLDPSRFWHPSSVFWARLCGVHRQI
jgi:hypothetical protein